MEDSLYILITKNGTEMILHHAVLEVCKQLEEKGMSIFSDAELVNNIKNMICKCMQNALNTEEKATAFVDNLHEFCNSVSPKEIIDSLASAAVKELGINGKASD